MDLPHPEKLIYTHILQKENHYAEFHFGITAQFIIDVTEYLSEEHTH